jgi:hypothetical protein
MPLGYRSFAYNYGFQFVVLPDRVLQFFELGHGDIWDGGHPDDPPQPHGWDTRSMMGGRHVRRRISR